MKTPLYIVYALLLLVVLAPFASAGTLVSGSSVDVQSNYGGLNGLSLVGTWSTTPATSDSIFIIDSQVTNNAVTDPVTGATGQAALKAPISIDIPAPKINQVFRVKEQVPLITAAMVDKSFWTGLHTTDAGASQDCIDKIEADLAASQKELYPGTEIAYAYSKLGSCLAVYVVQQEHKGWVGPVIQQGYDFEQDIKFSDGQQIQLKSATGVNNVVGTIPNFARATFLGFSQWTKSPLDIVGVYGYHMKSSLGSDVWKPFYSNAGTSLYSSKAGELNSVVFSTGYYTMSSSYKNSVQTKVNEINNQVSTIVSQTGKIPYTWEGDADTTAIKYSANDIIVPLKKTILTANIQLVLKGDKFGLYIPTGKPSIVSTDSSISFDETRSAQFKYAIKNIGANTGTFAVTASCSPVGVVSVDSDTITLTAGQTSSGQTLTVTGKTDIATDQKLSCVLSVKETNTGETVTKAFTATVVAKASCVQGQETDPFIEGANFVVNVLDSSCKIINTKTCPMAGSSFILENGAYVCKTQSGPSIVVPECSDGKDNDGNGLVDSKDPGCSNPLDDTEKEDKDVFLGWVVWVAVVAAFLAAGLTYYYGRPIRKANRKYGKIIHVVLVLIVAAIVFFLVPAIVRWFISLFSFAI